MHSALLRRRRKPIYDGVLLLDADRGYIHPALAHTRSGQIVVPQADGSLAVVPSDTPARYWTPANGWAYRIDPAWTQSLLYTHDPSNSYWSKSALASPPAQTVTGPTGAVDGWVLTEDTTNTQHNIQRTGFSFTAGATVSALLVVGSKDGGLVRRNVRFVLSGAPWGGATQACWLNTDTGVISTTTGSVVGFSQQLAGGWWLCRFIIPSPTVTTTAAITVSSANVAGNAGYLGDGQSGIKFYAINISNLAAPGPLVQATSAAVIVGAPAWAAALASLGLAPGSTLSLGAAYWAEPETTPRIRTILQVDDGTSGNRAILRHSNVANQGAGVLVASGSTTYNSTLSSVTEGLNHNGAMRVSASGPGVAFDAASGVGGGSFPGFGASPTTIRVGSDISSAAVFSGGIRRAWISARALSDSYLRYLTA